MKKAGKAFLTIALIIVCLLGCYSCVAGNYNSLVSQEETVEAAWSNVQNQYQRRLDLIPNLVATVKGAAAHESDTLTAVTEARKIASAQINVSSDILNNEEAFQKYLQAQDQLGSSLSRLVAVAEAYPTLKANENFLGLQDQLEGTENRITVARKEYNEAAQSYNTNIRKFPMMLFARQFGFEKKAYIQASAEAQTAPKVEF